MSLGDDMVNAFGDDYGLPLRQIGRCLFRIGHRSVNIRGTSGLGECFWFDVTPRFFEESAVDFFVFVCGSKDRFYVIPASCLAEMIVDSDLCGAYQRPNFNIHLDTHELLPGRGQRFRIDQYFNNVAGLLAA